MPSAGHNQPDITTPSITPVYQLPINCDALPSWPGTTWASADRSQVSSASAPSNGSSENRSVKPFSASGMVQEVLEPPPNSAVYSGVSPTAKVHDS